MNAQELDQKALEKNKKRKKKKKKKNRIMAEEIPAVGATAFWIAGMRMEATRDGNPAVLNDPYAEKLLKAGEGEKHFAEFRKCGGVPGFIVFWLLELLIFPMWSIFNDLKLGRPWRGVLTSLKNAFRVLTCTPYSYTLTEHVRRTKFLDDIVTAGVAPARRDGTPRCEQVVVLGAGLDTRAWRLAIPSATLFIEVDHPSIFAHKEPIMEQHKPSCKRVALGLDYDQVGNWQEHAAQRATFNSAKATVFVLEGLTMYLKDDEQDALFASLGKTAAPGSVVAGDTYVMGGEKKREKEREKEREEKWNFRFS
jgi:O-methyltransferase involved in polyketide biosynthesis